ncbi:hypothetical protein LC593_34210 [Nostoc sp. CHAB 5844]|nr:hypothetical protein [Nostoc sp. CHAB 5844]
MENFAIFYPQPTWRIVVIHQQATILLICFESLKENTRVQGFPKLHQPLILYFLELIAAAGGFASSVRCLQLAKDTNDRLDKITAEI